MTYSKIFISACLLYFTTNVFAQYSLDTVSVKTVSDGVKHLHLVESSKPWNINITEVDITNPYLSIETSHADDLYRGNARTSEQAKLKSYEGHEVIAAINGDFYDGDGITTGYQVINGELLRSIQARDWSKIAFTHNSNPLIKRFNYSGKVLIKNQPVILNGINVTRAADYLVMYNSYMGKNSSQNEWGTEVLIQPIDSWIINDTVKCIVKSIEERTGNMSIEENHVVLSAHGEKESVLLDLMPGDTISILVNLTPGNDNITQMISGFPQIVKDGSNYALQGYANEGGSATFATDRHPRTGIGFNADSTLLYLVVVDGRQTGLSRGVSLPELADIMIQYGVYEGINLDGGGSSTMAIKGNVVNSPSDASERAVANSLLVVSSEPVFINKLNLFPDTVVTNLERPVQFWFDAIDLYGYKQNYRFDKAFASLTNNSIGTINNNGLFQPSDTGYTLLSAAIDDGLGVSKISVEDIHGEYLLDSFENIDKWFVTGKSIDTSATSIDLTDYPVSEGNSAIKLNYSFEYQTGTYYYTYLNTDIPLNGVPESVTIDALGNEFAHTLAFIISDENDEEFALIANKQITNQDHFEKYEASFNNPIEQTSNAKFYYPVRIKQIAVVLGSQKVHGTRYEGELVFDNLRIKYPDLVSVDVNEIPNEFKLLQNYPNPFNPTTTIEYEIPVGDANFVSPASVKLIIFDVLGREVATLVDKQQKTGIYKIEFDGVQLSSGVYLYKLSAGNKIELRKMLLIK